MPEKEQDVKYLKRNRMAIVNWNLLEVCLIPEKEQSELTHNGAT